MDKNGTDHLVTLELLISHDEEKRFHNYVKQGKFATPRLAFDHLLRLAEGGDFKGKMESDKVEAVEVNGGGDKDEHKDEKKGKGGRKGKKMAEEAAMSDMEMKPEETAPAGGSTGGKEASAEPEAKKTNGRRAKKAAEAAMAKYEDQEESGHDDQKDADNHDDASGDEEHPKKGKKRAPAKKPAARNGKQTADTEAAQNVTFSFVDRVPATEPTKKPVRGKKGAAAAKEQNEHEDGDGNAVDRTKGKTPPPKSAKDDAGDGAPEAKKRRGKAKVDDTEHQEPATGAKGRGKKAPAVEADDEHQDEPVAQGEGKKGGKRAPKTPKAAAMTEEPETAAASTKPKRRAAKQKNYAEEEEDCC